MSLVYIEFLICAYCQRENLYRIIYYVIPSEVPFFGTKSRNLPAWSTNPGISKRVRW